MMRRLAMRLVLSITVIVVIVAAISGLVNLKIEEGQLLNAMILGADQLSKSITSATWHAMRDDHREVVYQIVETIAAKQGVDGIRMYNRTGQLMFSTIPAESHGVVSSDAPSCASCHSKNSARLELDLPSRVRIFSDGSHRKLAMVTPIYNEKACSQAECHAHPAPMKVLGVLDISLGLDRVDADMSAMKRRVLMVTGVEIGLIGLFIVFFTQRFVSRPIHKLIEGTEAISQMELDHPLHMAGSSEEIDKLARSFDRMRERLRTALADINQFTRDLENKVEERTLQLKAAQQKLLQTDRLASLGQLSASVAHEINNPISGVLNLGMLMQRIMANGTVPPTRVEEFRKYLGQIVAETTRVGRIVSDLLSFSRRSKPQRAPGDLNKVVRTTLSLVQHKLTLGNVETETHLQEDLPEVPCDQSQIQQVVLNLLLNAAQATQSKGGGQVSITTESRPGEVVLTVADTGEGIPPEYLSKIFDPFFTTKPEGKGVGLGLAVSYGIIQAHGGDIEVKSKVGEGTSLIISLPLEQAKRE
jgi:two-component system NtrC family sensor kinase